MPFIYDDCFANAVRDLSVVEQPNAVGQVFGTGGLVGPDEEPVGNGVACGLTGPGVVVGAGAGKLRLG